MGRMDRVVLALVVAALLLLFAALLSAGSKRHGDPNERRLVEALDAYCVPIEYRDAICQVTLPQGFGE
jgi:hypothetical protein